jgi:hypothetical protein
MDDGGEEDGGAVKLDIDDPRWMEGAMDDTMTLQGVLTWLQEVLPKAVLGGGQNTPAVAETAASAFSTAAARVDQVGTQCRAARGDLQLVLDSLQAVEPAVFGVLAPAVGQEDVFWTDVQTGTTQALTTLRAVLTRLGELVLFAREQLRGAAKGAQVRAQARLDKLAEAVHRGAEALRATALQLTAQWQARALPYRSAQDQVLAALVQARDATPAGGPERAACDAAVDTLRALQNVLATAEEELGTLQASLSPPAVPEFVHALGLVQHVMKRTHDQVAQVVSQAKQAASKVGVGVQGAGTVRAVGVVQAALKAAEGRLAAAQKRAAAAEAAAAALASSRSDSPQAVEQLIDARREKQVAEADVAAAQDHVRVLAQELSRARVQDVVRQMDATSQAQTAWLAAARRLRSAVKKLAATAAAQHEKALMREAVVRWAADRSVAVAAAAVGDRLRKDVVAALEAVAQVLRHTAASVETRIDQETAGRPGRLALDQFAALMQQAPHRASTLGALALQYRTKLEAVGTTYVAGARVWLQFLYAWIRRQVLGVPALGIAVADGV